VSRTCLRVTVRFTRHTLASKVSHGRSPFRILFFRGGVDPCVARKTMFKPGVTADTVIQLLGLQFIRHLLVVLQYIIFQLRLMNWRHPRAEQTKQGRICVCVEDWRLPNPLTRGERRTTYLPFIRHFSPRASSASATERGIPTTTSALFVRRLKSGNACASGPEKGGKSLFLQWGWEGR